MEKDKGFLGTGWSFPPSFEKPEGKVKLTSGRVDIEHSLEVLFGTKLGERIMHPRYGCNLDDMVFESFNLSLKTYMEDLIETAILYHEPRIEPLHINIDDSFFYEGRLMIEIEYVIRVTNSRYNMVFPFYLEEGAKIQLQS